MTGVPNCLSHVREPCDMTRAPIEAQRLHGASAAWRKSGSGVSEGVGNPSGVGGFAPRKAPKGGVPRGAVSGMGQHRRRGRT